MKSIFSLCVSIAILFSLFLPVSAMDATNSQLTLTTYQEALTNGITITHEIIAHSQERASTKSYTHKATIRSNDTIVAIVSITGTFRYDGTTVSVVSKSVTQTDTYEGWSYKQNSFTSSGGTITLDAKLTKLLVMNIPFTMTLSCDKNGNISYT